MHHHTIPFKGAMIIEGRWKGWMIISGTYQEREDRRAETFRRTKEGPWVDPLGGPPAPSPRLTTGSLDRARSGRSGL